MTWLGRALQVVGLGMTGYAAVSAFWIEFTEAAMLQWGLGGLAVFWAGILLQRKAA